MHQGTSSEIVIAIDSEMSQDIDPRTPLKVSTGITHGFVRILEGFHPVIPRINCSRILPGIRSEISPGI